MSGPERGLPFRQQIHLLYLQLSKLYFIFLFFSGWHERPWDCSSFSVQSPEFPGILFFPAITYSRESFPNAAKSFKHPTAHSDPQPQILFMLYLCHLYPVSWRAENEHQGICNRAWDLVKSEMMKFKKSDGTDLTKDIFSTPVGLLPFCITLSVEQIIFGGICKVPSLPPLLPYSHTHFPVL